MSKLGKSIKISILIEKYVIFFEKIRNYEICNKTIYLGVYGYCNNADRNVVKTFIILETYFV